MDFTPKVSVVMPVFNGERFLDQAIESILAQTLREFEFIIVDDGSTDRSWEMIQTYAQNDSRIRALRQPQNGGLIAALNLGCAAARASYIARMDCDDVSLPSRLAVQFDFLATHRSTAVVGSLADWIDEDSTVFGSSSVPSKANLVRWTMLFTCCIVHPTVMMHSEIVKTVGYYRPESRHYEDYDLWRRIAQVADLANIPDVLLHYRVRKDSITAKHNVQMTDGSIRTIQQWLSDLLDTDCSYELAQAFRATSNADVVSVASRSMTAEYIRKAYRCFTEKYPVPRAEKRQIVQSVLRKHLKLSRAEQKVSRSEGLRLAANGLGFSLIELVKP